MNYIYEFNYDFENKFYKKIFVFPSDLTQLNKFIARNSKPLNSGFLIKKEYYINPYYRFDFDNGEEDDFKMYNEEETCIWVYEKDGFPIRDATTFQFE